MRSFTGPQPKALALIKGPRRAWLPVALALMALPSRQARAGALRDACRNEASLFCQGLPEEGDALLRCLTLNLDGLMPPCRRRLGGRPRAARKARPADPSAPSLPSLDPSRWPWMTATLEAIRTRDDDGARPAPITPDEFGKFAAFANSAYESCRIRFAYDPGRDFTTLDSTVLNGITDANASGWPAAERLANEKAARHPGKIPVIVRHGPGADAWGNNFAGPGWDFVIMGGYGAGYHCGHPHVEALGHELGHYLNLGHTFPGEPSKDMAEALARFRYGGGRAAFDGDGLADTPEDPEISGMECDHARKSVVLDGVELVLPRTNIMSYYDEAGSLSPMQCQRARDYLAARQKKAAAPRAEDIPAASLKAESLPVLARRSCSEHRQDMSGFGKGLWRDDSQLFVGCDAGGSLTLGLSGQRPGRYRLVLYPTSAPDFSRLGVFIDARPVGDVIDLYSPQVLPAGRTVMGEFDLPAGGAALEFRVLGKNPASQDPSQRWGLDSVALEPAP